MKFNPEQTYKTVWIDVTDLEMWRGSLTGIQRTQMELCKYLPEYLPVKYFTFIPDKGYFEVDFPKHEFIGKAEVNTKLNPGAHHNGAKRTFVASKELVASITPNLIKKSVRKLRLINSNSKYKAKRFSFQSPFEEEETILFLGVTWSIEGHLFGIKEIKKKLNLRVFSLVYDLIPVLKPHFFGVGFPPHYTNHLVDVCHISDEILSISQNTTKDLVWFMKETLAPEKPIWEIRLGDNPIRSTPRKPSGFPDNINDFVLSVGTIEVRKNHDLLVKTWEKTAEERIEIPDLVLAGRPGWLTHDLEFAIKNNPLVNRKIHVLNECSDENLKWLYKHAMFTIYPSWYEGWGLPVAESCFEGKLCLSSNSSSMPEIAGDLIEYFSPYSVEELQKLVLKFTQNRKLLSEINTRLKSSYVAVNWNDTAKEIVNVLAQKDGLK